MSEVKGLLDIPYSEFKNKFTNIRSVERNFQLIVEFASDINAQIALERGFNTPNNYWESFREIEKLGIISQKISKDLIKSAKLRNILIHEYDFDQDNFIFYKSVKNFMPIYKNYIEAIEKYYKNKK